MSHVSTSRSTGATSPATRRGFPLTLAVTTAVFATACSGGWAEYEADDGPTTTAEKVENEATPVASGVITDPELMELRFGVWKTTGGTAQEFIVIDNVGTETVSLVGWTFSAIRDDNYEFTDTAIIEPGKSFRLFARCGTDSPATGQFFWCFEDDDGSGPWDDSGGEAELISPDGEIRLAEGYTASFDE